MKKLFIFFFINMFFLVSVCLTITVTAQINNKFRKSSKAIPNRYIVILNKDVGVNSKIFENPLEPDKVSQVSSDLSFLYGGRVERLYRNVVKGYSVELSEQQAIKLSKDSRVKYVEEDFLVTKDNIQNDAPWGLDRIDQRNLPLNTTYNYATDGTGVHVYILDTGIRSTHSEFTGRVGVGADFVNDGQNGNDCDGHGTHVAGTIGGTTYGVAKNVTIHAVRVLGCSGSGSGSAILAGIDWISTNRILPAVANMSLGGGFSNTENNAVANSIAQGITYVVSAGNDNNDACDKSPASAPDAITVGATTINDVRSSFSNYGVCVDTFAPGSSILSSINTSDTATAFYSGTSMASPHVAGVVARFLQSNPTASPNLVANSIINSATNGVVSNPGVGSPNRLLYADVIVNNTPVSAPIAGPAPAVRINDNSIATPYPSEYVVSGRPPIIGTDASSIEVNINGFSHTATGDTAFVLEGPTGARILLQSGAGENEEANSISYKIGDTGNLMSTSQLTGLIYKPTALRITNFPSPGPGISYNNPGPINSGTATLASTFGGTNPNGVWKLYVIDEYPGDRGRIDSWSVITKEPTPPTQPTNLRATVVSDTQINVSWDASPANQRIVSYSIRTNYGTYITGITSNSYSLTGLLSGTSHIIQVVAVNSFGLTSSDAISTTASTTGNYVPAPPTSVSVAPFPGGNSLYLSWSPALGGIPANYNIRVNGSAIISGVNGIFYALSGLNPNTTYSIEIQAVSSIGIKSSWSSIVNGTTTNGVTPTPAPVTTTASFVGFDAANKGNWLGNYAAQGVSMVGDATSLPAYVQLSATGQNTHIWAPSTTDPRALNKASNNSDRIAATFYTSDVYSPTKFDLNFNFTDGQIHRLALYSVDWDNLNRQQTFELVNTSNGAILDSRTISNFGNGVYVVWNVQGQFTVRVKNAGGTSLNAVLSGIFLDPPSASVPAPPIATPTPTPAPVTTTASFVGFDAANKGNWLGNYAAQGVSMVGDATSLPAWAQLSVSGQNTHIWAPSTTDPRALYKASNNNDRIAATFYTSGTYNASQFDLNFNFTDGQIHRLALYSVDWDNLNRQQTFELVNTSNGAILDSRTISNFGNGVYVVWNVQGQFTVRVKNAGGTSLNAVLSGIFLDPPSASVPAPPIATPTPTPAPVTTTASFVGFDAANKGNWLGNYAAQGVSMVGDATSLPAYVQLSATGQNTHIWAPSTTDPRALYKASNNNDRIAATFYTSGTYNASQFDLNFNFTDGQVHRLALYSVDWDNLNRQQTFELVNTSNGAILDSRTISNFGNGVYVVWNVQGQFTVRVKNAGGTSLNAVLSGIFLDNP